MNRGTWGKVRRHLTVLLSLAIFFGGLDLFGMEALAEDLTVKAVLNLDGGTVNGSLDNIIYYVSGGDAQGKGKVYSNANGTGEEVTSITDPAKNNYTFSKWQIEGGADVGNSSELLTAIKNLTAGETYKAVYTQDTYTVKFDSNDGTGTMSDQTIYRGTGTALKKNTFTKDGYTFAGWATTNSATEAMYSDGQEVKDLADKNDNITLYAVWTKKKYTLTATLNKTTSPTSSPNTSVTVSASGVTVEQGTNFTITVAPTAAKIETATTLGGAVTIHITAPASEAEYTITVTPKNTDSIKFSSISPITMTWKVTTTSTSAPAAEGTTKSGSVFDGGDSISVAGDSSAYPDTVSGRDVYYNIKISSDYSSSNSSDIGTKKGQMYKNFSSTGIQYFALTCTVKDKLDAGYSSSKTKINGVVRIKIPIKDDLKRLQVYRYHDGVDIFKETKSDDKYEDGYFYVGSDYIYIFTNRFSTYAIAYGNGTSSKVEFELNGGTASTSLPPFIYYQGDKAFTWLPTVTRSGYTFSAWKDQDTNTITTSTNVADDGHYYVIHAEWKANSAATATPTATKAAGRAAKTLDKNTAVWLWLIVILAGAGVVWFATGGLERINRKRKGE